ncbi:MULTISPECIES: ABC transporter permease [Hyphobacterium]|uniref:ABC transporter permease n=1 Tax=Hyphobacterium vulgare TaxID=1736751 RepID=A0ABV6ZUQ8_9PROT
MAVISVWRRRVGLPPVSVILAVTAAGVATLPLLAVLVLAVTGSGADGYLQHLASTRLPGYAANTVLVLVTAAAGAALIGTGLGWLIARTRFPGRSIFEWALALPLAMPAYIAAYGWLDLTLAAGPLGALPTVRGWWGAGVIFAVTLYPYVYLLTRDAFLRQPPHLEEAARALGRSGASAFLTIALPAARPAIAAGLALVAMEALADYGAVIHLGAPTLTVGVLRAWSGAGSLADAARLAVMIVAIALVLTTLERAGRSRARTAGQRSQPNRTALGPGAALLAIIACLTPLLLALVAPLARLAWHALHSEPARNVWNSSLNSISLAAVTACLAALFGLASAYALRSGGRFAAFPVRTAMLGYAAPGAVAAVGVLAVLGTLQSGLDRAAGGIFPVLLTGTVLALVFAYLTRFAAAAIGPCEAALGRIPPSLDEASHLAGAGPVRRFVQIHWPLASGGILAAALIVFVEVLKELPATMILRPFNFDTLAVVAHNYASDERLGQSALPALVLVALALPAMAIVARQAIAPKRIEVR